MAFPSLIDLSRRQQVIGGLRTAGRVTCARRAIPNIDLHALTREPQMSDQLAQALIHDVGHDA